SARRPAGIYGLDSW
nr:immunoglobulin heavy chain junction region [Macaca mulatta]